MERDGERGYYESEESDGQYERRRKDRLSHEQRRSEGKEPFPELNLSPPGTQDTQRTQDTQETRVETLEMDTLTPASLASPGSPCSPASLASPGFPSRSSSPLSVASGELGIVASRRLTTESVLTTASLQPSGPFAGLQRFWWAHVSVRVPRKQNRDHFALERTFLAYMRTSLTFAMVGVLIAQLFSLNHAVVHNAQFGFHRVGKPLACVCHVLAILVAVAGAYRFWRQQHALARGKVYAGGRELNFIALVSAAIVAVIFGLVIAISARRDSEAVL
ncbi:hypothetical protein MGYG_04636 [Nannizzia gypsea CBS 118893]|uniref:DUF202 domain-containing protein n=1 Tax=Arthroderma gypseum (strain ATCC MYA-4604 / CBS 118893) TaxID=535722 RepID=E4UVX3_ARTGP|nr:hypothetical protein MGYG_04636 [Nannizzia gypsea CBS 118893]EFR01634.1 hypothetical protein MGYG_04636 [Nannizzia gypsea CBS 118893]